MGVVAPGEKKKNRVFNIRVRLRIKGMFLFTTNTPNISLNRM